MGCRNKANCPHVGPGPRGNVLREGLFKGSQPVFMRVPEKTTENSERPGRQARSEIELGTSRLTVQRSATGGANDPLNICMTDSLIFREYTITVHRILTFCKVSRYPVCDIDDLDDFRFSIGTIYSKVMLFSLQSI